MKLAFVHLQTNTAVLSLLYQVCSLWKFPVEHMAVSSDVCICTAKPPGDASFWTCRLTVQADNWCNTDCPISQSVTAFRDFKALGPFSSHYNPY